VRGLLVHPAQHAEGGTHLAQQVAARLLDRGERGSGLLRVVVHQVERHPGLHVDERDVVAEHVVQVARDPQPFLAAAAAFGLLRRGLRLLAPFAPGPPQLHRRDVGGEPRQPPRRARDGEVRSRVAQDVHHQGAGERDGGDRVPRAPVAAADGGAERDDRGERHRPERVAGREVDQEHPGDPGEHDGRVPPAEDQRGGSGQQQQPAEHVEVAQAGAELLGERRADEGEHGDGDGEHHGGQDPRPPDRTPAGSHGPTLSGRRPPHLRLRECPDVPPVA
jgi:hypothetical protein